MAKVVASWKAFTGRRISDVIRQVGAERAQVWHREYWDRFIRDAQHYSAALAYIHNNPVKAGLVAKPEHWPWGSAAAGNDLPRNRLPGNARLCPGASEKNAGTEPGDPSKTGEKTR